MVIKVHDNATYSLRELDGTRLKVPIAGKRIKIFKQRDNRVNVETIIEEFDLEDYDEDSEVKNDMDEFEGVV